jgi:DNA modification methylase
MELSSMAPVIPSALPTIEIDVASVIVGDRIRKDFSGLADLVDSIREHGLIQPIVVTANHTLIAGENRLRAHRELGLTKIKAVYLEVVDAAHLTILEASENIVRRDFTWQEQVLAIDKVHSLKSVEYALKSESWGVRETGRLLNTAKSSIHRAVFIAGFLRQNDPEVTAAGGLKEAFAVLLKRREAELTKALVAQTIPKGSSTQAPAVAPVPRKEVTDDEFFAEIGGGGTTGFTPGITAPVDLDERPGGTASGVVSVPSVPLSEMVFHADSVAWLRSARAECFDACITDWPYGIDMDNLQQDGGGIDISSTRAEHDVRSNEQLHADIVPLIYAALKPSGWFITWTDMAQWQRNYDLCIAAGFKVQRWPLIWHKTSVCQNMAAQYNFTKNFEIAIVCRKGNSTLLRPQASSVYSGGNDAEAKALGHPFAKPFGLWEWLYNATSLRGSSVLDPFVGRGSSTIPAIRLGLRPTGVETNEAHYNALHLNLQNFYKSLDPTCTFR